MPVLNESVIIEWKFGYVLGISQGRRRASLKNKRGFFRRQGQAQAEYGLIIALVSIAAVGALIAIYVLDNEMFHTIVEAFRGIFY